MERRTRKKPKQHRAHAARRAQPDAEPATNEGAGKPADVLPELGANLRRRRTEQGFSLEKLGQVAGVSRAMLGQIELGQSIPTIKTLWKIARALDVPFSALISGGSGGGSILLRASQTSRLTNQDGTFVSRALFPLGGPRRVEFYELHLAAHAEERAVPHPPGTVENLVVNQGVLEIEVRGATFRLDAGDVLVFEADADHIYRNPAGKEALVYLVMSYAQLS